MCLPRFISPSSPLMPFIGLYSPLVWRTQFFLAETLRSRGEYQAARALHEHVLTRLYCTYGRDHPHTAESLCALADTLRAAGMAVTADETASTLSLEPGDASLDMCPSGSSTHPAGEVPTLDCLPPHSQLRTHEQSRAHSAKKGREHGAGEYHPLCLRLHSFASKRRHRDPIIIQQFRHSFHPDYPPLEIMLIPSANRLVQGGRFEVPLKPHTLSDHMQAATGDTTSC